MKILVIGGTVFLGRHIVEAALERGHEVTLFNRGKHNPELFPKIEKIKGDREADLALLGDRTWDAAIDTCGYVPRIVRISSEALRGSVSTYVFISTLSVYADMSRKNMDEQATLATIPDETVEQVTGETYGALKALCEKEVLNAFQERAFIPRPGLIVGPHDPTDRFTYWPARISKRARVLAPEPQDLGVMFIDVRDLSEWIISMIERNQRGVYNADGPDYPLTMKDFLDVCKKVSSSNAEFVWADAGFLFERDVQPWVGLPMWLPGAEGQGMSTFNVSKATGSGLKFRPLDSTIKDTLEWHATRPSEAELRAGISPEREEELLEEWTRLHPQATT
jgi:2'-hydroxyisoflavone reductase